MSISFRDLDGEYLLPGIRLPFPVAGAEVLRWMSDDFNGTSLDQDKWTVSGSPTLSNSVLTVPVGATLLSKQQFWAPCLVEAVCTMTARASTDNFRIGLYRDNNNLVEWGATGTNTANMDAYMSAGGVADNQTAINVGAANNTYRLATIYVGLGEVVWAFRPVNAVNTRTEVYRYREHGIPDGPFKIRLAGLAGTSSMKVHRVTAYQLADSLPPGSLGHNVDAMALPVRVTNGPFVASPTNPALPVSMAQTDTFTALAAGAVGTGNSRAFYQEMTYIQAVFMGAQPFSWWVEGQPDGSNWQVLAHGTSSDATTDGVVRYFAVSPVLRVLGSRYLRVKVKNTGTAAADFRGTLTASVL